MIFFEILWIAFVAGCALAAFIAPVIGLALLAGWLDKSD